MDEGERQKRFRDADERNTAKQAELLGVKYRDLRGEEETLTLLKDELTIDEMYKNHVVPLLREPGSGETFFGVTLATPRDFVKNFTEQCEKEGKFIELDMISDSAFRAMMRRFDPPKTVVYSNIEIKNAGASETLAKVSDEIDKVRSDDLLDYLISQADKLGASDIHLENERDFVRIRLRIDGTLHPIANLTHEKYRILFSSIASVANLSTAAETAQSGHIVKIVDGHNNSAPHELNMRIETVPTTYGQDAVIRLFNFDEKMLNMDVLGMTKPEQDALRKIIDRPSGMLMIVGPTGSGKSTTLYSVIESLNDTSRKILTLEDPVEFDVPGVVQVPVDTTHGYSFVDELRTVLRLDPDVVMVGEIRDNDTAKTAIQAAITGHLLLATFHADDAAAAFARLIDMIGINPVFASAIRMVVGQRLVRKLDREIAEEYEPDEATAKWVRDELKNLPAEGVDLLRETYPVNDDGSLDLAKIRLWRAGSSDSDPFGYQGRTVLMELLEVDEDIAKFLRGEATDVSAKAIRDTARKNGMVTMLQKGLIKCLRGDTTIEEVNRVL